MPPLFTPLCSQTQNPWNPYFCSVSWRFRGRFAPPPKASIWIFSAHKRITAKVRFVNKVGALFVPRKRFRNPYFYSVSCDKNENAMVFWARPCPISKPNACEKNPLPRGKYLFSPKHSDDEERQKIYCPLPVGPTHKPPPTRFTTKWQHRNRDAQTTSPDIKLKNQHDHTAAKKQQPKMKKISKTKNNDITTNKKQQRIPYSLQTYSKYI